jgi:hypothetical protein
MHSKRPAPFAWMAVTGSRHSHGWRLRARAIRMDGGYGLAPFAWMAVTGSRHSHEWRLRARAIRIRKVMDPTEQQNYVYFVQNSASVTITENVSPITSAVR